ncbi:uncharacterized protein LOC135110213 [Scylla paramamosain]|uniref:uncharacterized protein LOC135110213 n=1 Tax=Scylla paramamosain TaxID=85552 RepID=UPI003083A1C9
MRNVGMASKALAVVVMVVACLAVQVRAWGSYSCNITPVDQQHIVNATLQSAQQVNSSLSSLEEKVDTILALLQPPGPPQAPWLPPPPPRGAAERGTSGKRERREREERSREEELTTVQNKTEEEHDRENVTEKPRDDDREGRTEATDRIEREQAVTKLETTTRKPERREEEEEKEEEDSTGPGKGQCSVMVTDNHATIGMFYMTTYNHGHCANRYPITSPIRYCVGFCHTRTFVTRKEGIWSQGHECKSCQPSRMETLRIPLACDDGFTFEKNFKNVVECKCAKCRPMAR